MHVYHLFRLLTQHTVFAYIVYALMCVVFIGAPRRKKQYVALDAIFLWFTDAFPMYTILSFVRVIVYLCIRKTDAEPDYMPVLRHTPRIILLATLIFTQ